jgi:hypothetical protein
MKKFIKILCLFVILTSCEYEPIFSTKKTGFSISNIEVINQNNLTKQIIRSLKEFQNNDNERVLSLEIKTEKIKEVTAKDSKGNTKSFRSKIICDFKIFKNDKLIKSKEIIENFSYNNDSDKFKLRKYESNIEKILVNRIIENIILELYSL